MNTVQYQQVMRFLLKNYTKMPVFVCGHTGIGKTAIPEALAKEEGIPTVYLNATGLEPQDLIGLPFREGDTTRFLPPHTFNLFKTEKRGIFTIDEVPRLDLSVRNTVMQMLDRRELGEVRIPEGWLILLLANPNEQGYQGDELDKALLRRCMVLEMHFDLLCWQKWAVQQGISGRIIGAVSRIKQVLTKTAKIPSQEASPFGGVIADGLLKAGLDRLDPGLQYEVLRGIVGDDAGRIIRDFLNDKELKDMLETLFSCKELPESKESPKLAELVYMFVDYMKKVPFTDGKMVTLDGKTSELKKGTKVDPDPESIPEDYVKYYPNLTDKDKRGAIVYNLYRALPNDIKPVLLSNMMSEIMYWSQDDGKKSAYHLLADEWMDLCSELRETSKEWLAHYEQTKEWKDK